MLNKKYNWVFLFLFFSSISFASGLEESLGNFKINESINLIQTCDCSYVTITTIRLGNGTLLNVDENMTKSGTFFNYTLNVDYVQSFGEYLINGNGDPKGIVEPFTYVLYVTKSGDNYPINPFLPLITLLSLAFFSFIISFKFKNNIGIFTSLGFSLLLLFVSVQYTLIIIQEYTLIENPAINSFIELVFQVFGWVVGGLITLIIIWAFLQIKKLADIRKGWGSEL